MRNIAFSVALVGVALVHTPHASAGTKLNVYAGYLNNLDGFGLLNPADIPTPFDADANTTLISSGAAADPHDTGVLWFENAGDMDVTIDAGVNVEVNGGATVFQIWDASLPITLQPGKSLVLAETANFNFDSSDFGLGANPVVKGTINAGSLAFSFEDTGRILLGRDDALGNKETTPYGQLGMVPEPSSLVLVCGSLLGLVARRRRVA